MSKLGIVAALMGVAIVVFLLVSPLSLADWLLLIMLGLYGT